MDSSYCFKPWRCAHIGGQKIRVAIVGAGVAGCYLSFHLSKEHEVSVFDREHPDKLGMDCAWGTSLRQLKKYCNQVGLKPSEYVKHRCHKLESSIVEDRDTVTFNKNRFLRNLIVDVDFQRKRITDTEELKGYDLVLDTSGANRCLLPKTGLEKDWLVPCFQERVKSSELPEDFYVTSSKVGVGYFWVFPLGNSVANVGCGSLELSPFREVKDYLSERSHEKIDEMGGTIRMIPPSQSTPFHKNGNPPVVGVGESIGTVSPLYGEGISSTLKCADLFLESFEKHSNDFGKLVPSYRKSVLKEFEWIDTQFEFMKSVRSGGSLAQIQTLLGLKNSPYSSANLSKSKSFFRGVKWKMGLD